MSSPTSLSNASRSLVQSPLTRFTAPPRQPRPGRSDRRSVAPFDTGQLLDFTTWIARDIAAGAYTAQFDADERWHQRIYRDRRVDVWLISWLPEQSAELHDHGGSSGAFTVLQGTLTEVALVAGAGAAASFDRPTGSSVAFGPRYIHDVRNTHEEPAVSVHAYSPPLTSMTFYDLGGGVLTELATLDTDDPEAPAPQLSGRSGTAEVGAA